MGFIIQNDKFNVVGTNIVEKAAMKWSVADMLRGPFKNAFYADEKSIK